MTNPAREREREEGNRFSRWFLGGLESGLTAASTMLSPIGAHSLAGLHGLGALAYSGSLEHAADVVRDTTSKLTYKPQTEEGRAINRFIGGKVSDAAETTIEFSKRHAPEAALDTVQAAAQVKDELSTAYPALGAGFDAATTVLLDQLGFRGRTPPDRMGVRHDPGGLSGKAGVKADTWAEADRRMQEAREGVLADPVVWTPPSTRAQILDRTEIDPGGHREVTQEFLPGKPPGPRVDTSSIDMLFDDPRNVAFIQEQANRGRGAGGELWYQSTRPIRTRMGELNSPLEFEDFAWANAHTSPQSPVPVNAPTATALMYLRANNRPVTLDEMLKLPGEFGEKYGGVKWPNYFATADKVEAVSKFFDDKVRPTGWDKQQKVGRYGWGLEGNVHAGPPLDTHELSGLSYGTPLYPYYRGEGSVQPTKYGLFSENYTDVLDQIGLTPLSGQASRWTGGGELTGLKTGVGDYLSILEQLARYKAASLHGDRSRAAAARELDLALTGEEPLIPVYSPRLLQFDPEDFR